tara:strand:+ start:24616 stop:24882 length:267 start_codon:yes stop_codon:yes gene_type:complete
MNIQLIILVFEICFAIFLFGFGLRFVFYDEDGPNMDYFYKRFFSGRVRKKHAEFTRMVGFIFLAISFVYLGLLIWNDFSPVTLLILGD